jgi:hypothetical protein
MAASLLMRLTSERRSDDRPSVIQSTRALLTDDQEAIALEVVFGSEPDDVVDIYFDLERDEVFDAGMTEGAFTGAVALMNSGKVRHVY